MSQVTLSEIVSSVKMLGFVVGAGSVLVLFLILGLYAAWRRFRQKRQLITIEIENGTIFQVSFSAVFKHLTLLLSHNYPEISICRLKVFRMRGGKGYGVYVEVLVNASMNLQFLRGPLQEIILESLSRNMGLPDVFQDIQIVVKGLRNDGKEIPAPQVSQVAATQADADDFSPLPEAVGEVPEKVE